MIIIKINRDNSLQKMYRKESEFKKEALSEEK